MNALYDPKRKKKKIRKWMRTILIIVFVVLACYVGQVVIDNTIGRFENIFDSIDFYHNIEKEDIQGIVYGDSSALVLYREYSEDRLDIYNYKNKSWVRSNGDSRHFFNFDTMSIGVYKPHRGTDWYLSIHFYSENLQDDIILNAEGSVFYQCTEDTYYAAIHPTSENYQININGEDITIQLEGFKGKEK